MIALGVVVISKATKVFNIAHGNIMMMMAFFAWWLLTDIGLPMWAAAPLVVLFPVIGMLINILFGGRMGEKAIGLVASLGAGAHEGHTTDEYVLIAEFQAAWRIALALMGG